MRALFIPILAILLIGGGAGLLVWWLRQRLRPAPGGAAVAEVLAAQGTARCIAASRLFRRLAERRDERAIASAWDAVELPVVQALPDCPPDYKLELINTLDALANACATRDLAKRIMTMRNSLLA